MNVHELAASVRDLATLPDIYLRLRRLANDPASTVGALAEVVSADAALSSRLLRLVNSPFYGLSSKVDSIARAVNLIGTDELCSLALVGSLDGMFSDLPATVLDLKAYWWRNVLTALHARELGRAGRVRGLDRLFVAGILHDVGRLAAAQQMPTLATEVERQQHGPCDWQRQIAAFDFSYAELGAELLGLWGMPPALVEPIACQHQPGRAEHCPVEAAVLHLATRIVSAPEGTADEDIAVEAGAWEQARLEPDVLDDVRERVAECAPEFRNLL